MPSRSSIPPPKPANPPQRPAAPHYSNDNVEPNEVPDIAKPEIDLLNMIPQHSNNNSKNIPPKEASFDLLGGFGTAEAQGSSAMPDLLSESQTKSHGLDDIFGSFGQTNNATSSKLPDLGNIGLNFNANNASATGSSNAVNFDPFGTESAFVVNAEPLRPTSNDTSPSQAKQPPTSAQMSKDPFADMANLASGLNLNWGSQPTSSRPSAGTSPLSTQFSSPTHQFGGFSPNSNANANPASAYVHQARSPMENPSQSRPDYSRSHFETKQKQNGANAATNAPQASSGGGVGDIFADILGQQGYNFATKPQSGPRTINAMRKEELVKDMDPDKLKIMEWVSSNV